METLDGIHISDKYAMFLLKSRIKYYITSEIYYDRGNHYEFVKLDKDLARPGDLTESCSFPFEFLKVVKQYESYTGRNVRLRYVM